MTSLRIMNLSARSRFVVIIVSAGYFIVAIRHGILAISIGNLFDCLISLGAFVMVYATSSVRYAAFKLTTAILFVIGVISVFAFFPTFGFDNRENPDISTLFVQYIVFLVLLCSLLAAIYLCRKDIEQVSESQRRLSEARNVTKP